MTIKAGYKQTEVGVIPKDWAALPLSNLTVLMTNGFVGTAKTHYTDSPDGILYIQGYNVQENSFNFKGIKRVTLDFHKKQSKSCLREGDVLMVQTGEVGLTTIIPTGLAGSNCHALIISRFKTQKLEPLFFSYYLNSEYGRSRLKELEVGTTMKHINVGDLVNFHVPVPRCRNEQEAIAQALSDVDALIEAQEKLIAKKQAIKTATMQQLLTGKKRLPPFDKTHTGYKQTELGKIPNDWEVRTVFQIAGEKKSQFDDGDWIESEHITDKGVRLIQTGNIGIGCFVEKEAKKYIYPESFTKLNCKELFEGDLLICRLADPAGRASIFPSIDEERVITSVDVTIFRPDESEVSRKFLEQYFSTSQWFKSVLELVGGTTHKRISRGSLGRILVPLTCFEEQKSIAGVLSDMDKEIEALKAKLQKTKSIKQGMMQELLTGRTRLPFEASKLQGMEG